MPRTAQKAILAALLVAWIVSFFLPAMQDSGPWPGYRAALGSVFSLWGSVIGFIELFTEELSVSTTPSRGGFPVVWITLDCQCVHGDVSAKAGVALLAVWDVMILAAPWLVAGKTASPLVGSLRAGYFLWQASVLGMTIFLWLVREQAKRFRAEADKKEASAG